MTSKSAAKYTMHDGDSQEYYIYNLPYLTIYYIGRDQYTIVENM